MIRRQIFHGDGHTVLQDDIGKLQIHYPGNMEMSDIDRYKNCDHDWRNIWTSVNEDFETGRIKIISTEYVYKCKKCRCTGGFVENNA